MLSVACSPEQFAAGMWEVQDFSLSILLDEGLPETTPTKANGAAQPRLLVLLWRYENEVSFGKAPDYCYIFTPSAGSDLETTVTLSIPSAKYRLAVWMDWVGGDAGPGYELIPLGSAWLPSVFPVGESARDAFTVVTDCDVRGSGGNQQTVTLRRPVAQLRIVAPEALTFLTATGLDPTQLRATLRYPDPIPDGYDLLQGTAGSTRAGVVLTGTPRYEPSGELVFISDFLFLPDAADSIPVEFTLTDASGRELIVSAGEVPLRGGHKTTVAFDKLRPGDYSSGGIGIQPGFDDEIEITLD